MNIFLGIIAVVLFLLMFNEKDQSKRKDLRYSFIAVVAVYGFYNALNLIF